MSILPRRPAIHPPAERTVELPPPYMGEIRMDSYLAALHDPNVQATLERAAAQMDGCSPARQGRAGESAH